MLFGRKKEEGKTFLVFDVETGSVGGALVRTDPESAPRLFGETRIDLPAGASRDAHTLRERAGSAVENVAQGLLEVAARLRGHESAPIGVIARSAFFLAAPWGVPDLAAGTPRFSDELIVRARAALGAHGIPSSFHARASAALHGARALLPYEDTYLLLMPSGEIIEALSVEGGAVASYGTMPVGRHTLLRTLTSHGSLHEHEARSALRAFSLGGARAHAAEPLRAAGEHIAAQFNDLAHAHGWHGHDRVYTIAHEGDWLARTLAQSAAATRFSPGATVKHIRPEHLSEHFSQHAQNPDLSLMLGALFVDSHDRYYTESHARH